MSSNLSSSKGEILIAIARASISEALAQPFDLATDIAEDAEWLQQPGACFVTLTQNGELRGCIGTLEAHRSLLEDVKANARAAALKDTRFAPLTAEELDDTDIEISLLSTMQDIKFADEQDALAQLQPGIDGVVFEFGHYRSTFLPQVWEQLPKTKDFMEHLKRKAGLSPDFWADGVSLKRYTVSKWKQHDLETQAP